MDEKYYEDKVIERAENNYYIKYLMKLYKKYTGNDIDLRLFTIMQCSQIVNRYSCESEYTFRYKRLHVFNFDGHKNKPTIEYKEYLMILYNISLELFIIHRTINGITSYINSQIHNASYNSRNRKQSLYKLKSKFI